MSYQAFFVAIITAFLLVSCAKKNEESYISLETQLNDESEILSQEDEYAYSGSDHSIDSETDEYLIGELSSSEHLEDRSNCTGSETLYTCVDPNNGNTYEITKYGNTTEVQGRSLSGSTWSQTSETIGNTTYTTGYDKDGNEWTQTGEKVGDTYYYNGIDSNGNEFNGSCDSYSGCSNY